MIVTVSANPAVDLWLTVPAVEYDVVLRATEVRRDIAGKGFNVSRFLKALHAENVAVALAGGYTGQGLEAGLNQLGVDTDFVYVEGETRTNVMVLESETGRHIKVNQPGPSVSPKDYAAFMVRVGDRIAADDIWVLTGSLPPGLPANFYADLATQVRAGGAKVVLDTSGAPLTEGCAARPYLVKPNVVEAEEFTGMSVGSVAEAATAVRIFLARGAETVILSMGGQGAVAGDSAGCYHLQPPPVKVRTAVSAGDALVAGAVWAMARNASLLEIARWGVTAGTVAAQNDSLEGRTIADLNNVYDQVTITSLETG